MPRSLAAGAFFMRWSFGEGKKYISDIRLSMAISDYEYTRDLVHGVVKLKVIFLTAMVYEVEENSIALRRTESESFPDFPCSNMRRSSRRMMLQ